MRFENLKAGDQVWVVWGNFTDPDARPQRPGYYPVVEVTETLGFFSPHQASEEAFGNLPFLLETGEWHSDQDVLPDRPYRVYNSEGELGKLQKWQMD